MKLGRMTPRPGASTLEPRDRANPARGRTSPPYDRRRLSERIMGGVGSHASLRREIRGGAMSCGRTGRCHLLRPPLGLPLLCSLAMPGPTGGQPVRARHCRTKPAGRDDCVALCHPRIPRERARTRELVRRTRSDRSTMRSARCEAPPGIPRPSPKTSPVGRFRSAVANRARECDSDACVHRISAHGARPSWRLRTTRTWRSSFFSGVPRGGASYPGDTWPAPPRRGPPERSPCSTAGPPRR